MPAENTYEPRIGSLAYRFIKHMQAPERAGQHMTRSQIVREFDVPSSAIDALLQTPTVNGALTKERNSSMEVCWRLSATQRINLREVQPVERTPAAAAEQTGPALPPAVATQEPIRTQPQSAFWSPSSPPIGLPPMPAQRVPRLEPLRPTPAPTPAPKPVQRPAAPPPAPRAPEPPPDAGPAYVIAAIAYDAPIRRGVPLLDVHQQRAAKYTGWLTRFQVGDSAEFARSETDEVTRAANEMTARNPGMSFRVANTGQQTAGIERTA
jgi:hypothetical protein